jgi:hypothetical protein
MPTTGSAKFPYPNSSAVPDVPADVLLLAQRIDKMSSGWTVCADATARAALVTNGDAYEGLHVYQIDTKVVYAYQSSAWVNVGVQPEATPVVPASVSGTGAVLSSGGLITCTATPTLNVITAFPADYRDFRIRIFISAKSATGDLIMRLRTGGSDSSASYLNLATYGNGSSTTTSGLGVTNAFVVDIGTGSGRTLSLIEIVNPNVATPSIMSAQIVGANATFRSSLAAEHQVSTAYPDFTLTIDGTKTFTGTVQITGLNMMT